MSLQGRSNSSSDGGRGGRSKSMNMRGHKLAKRLPHLNAIVDGTLSNPLSGLAISNHTITSTGTQTYTVPEGVDTITVTMYGAGGGGGKANASPIQTTNGFGGGSGSKCVFVLNEIQPGAVISFDVGVGGVAANASDSGDDGGDTTLTHSGTTYTAGGGNGGKKAGCQPTLYNYCPDGTGGTSTNGDTNTSGNNNSNETGGTPLGDSAGAGGAGSTNVSPQNYTNGGDGKVIIS